MITEQITKIEVVKKIEALAQEKGFIYSLALILLRDFIYDAEEAADIDWHSKLSLQEVSFLVGLMIKRQLNFEFIDEEAVKSQMERADQLFRDLHDCYNKPLKDQIHKVAEQGKALEGDPERAESIFGSGNAMAEAIFYGDSGAYDFQLWELAVKRYQTDKEWLIKNKGFQIVTAVETCKKLKDLIVYKHTHATQQHDYSEFLRMVLSIFCFTQNDLEGLPPDEVKGVLKSFSIKPGEPANKHLSLPGDYNIFNSNPIVVLEDGVYFVPILFNLAQSIYESPFYWMSQDDNYRESSFKNRGQATVDIAKEYLKNVFGASNVYEQVIVEKSKGHSLTDIDLLAITGNKAVVLQLKSKKLTISSRIGDEDRLKQDFMGAIQESYNQGKISRDAILKNNGKLIDFNGNEVHLDDSIDDVYILCVTSDFYPAVLYQAETFLKKDPADPHPVTLSLFDLEILAYYFQDPFEFLYYLRQRVSLHGCFTGQSEIDLIAYHLNQKIYPRKDDKSGQPIDWVLVQGMGQLIDAHYPSARGYSPITKAMEKLHTKWSNLEFQEIIAQIKHSKQSGFTDAIFFLYDLAGHGADTFMASVKSMKDKCQRAKKSLRLSAMSTDQKNGISYICDYNNDGKLPEHVEIYCKVKKYQMKANMWLGLGGFANSPRPFEMAMFSKEPWVQNDRLEMASRSIYLKPTNMNNGKKIGRNDGCFCGSGKEI